MNKLGITIFIISVILILLYLNNYYLENFEEVGNQEDSKEDKPSNKRLVLYYANWCGASKMFLPEWNNNIHNKLSIPTEMVECEETPDRCPHIKYFPTIILESGSGLGPESEQKELDTKKYSRNLEGILEFIKDN